MSFCANAAEIVPVDILAKIFEHCFHAESHRCVCDKPIMNEIRRNSCAAVQLVCRRWKLAWQRLVMNTMWQRPTPFCAQPGMCLAAYLKHAPLSYPYIKLKSKPWSTQALGSQKP